MATKTAPQERTEPTKDKTTKPSVDAGQVKKHIKSWNNYVRDHYYEIWEECWKAYRGERTRVNYAAPNATSTVDPMIYNLVETNVAQVFGPKPRTIYMPTCPEQTPETRVINQMSDYTWDRNLMSSQMITAGR